jgi:hypothetical protein
MALHSAGAIGGSPGSPMPVGGCRLGRMYTGHIQHVAQYPEQRHVGIHIDLPNFSADDIGRRALLESREIRKK